MIQYTLKTALIICAVLVSIQLLPWASPEQVRPLLEDLNVEAIQSISVQASEEIFQLERREGRWHFSKYVSEPIEQARVEEVLKHLLALKGKFLDPNRFPDDFRASFGLESPRKIYRVRERGGSERTLRIGVANAFTKSVYVAMSESEVALVPEAELQSIQVSSASFRERKVFQRFPLEPTRITIIEGNTQQEFAHGTGGWKDMRGTLVDSIVVAQLLNDLRSLEVEDFPTLSTKAQTGQALGEIIVSGHSGEETMSAVLFLLERVAETPNGRQQVLARSGERPSPFLLPLVSVRRLLPSASAFIVSEKQESLRTQSVQAPEASL